MMCYWQPMQFEEQDGCGQISKKIIQALPVLHSELVEVCLLSTKGNLKVEAYSSLTKRGQETNKGLSCLSGEVSQYGTDMPNLYIYGFACGVATC